MLVCSKCKSKVDLGLVFCPVCGDKMDTSRLDNAESIRRLGGRLPRVPWNKVAVVLSLALVLCVGLALWPHSTRIGEVGKKPFAKRLPDKMQLAESLARDQSFEISLQERDVNAYLAFVKAPAMGLHSLSTTFGPGVVRIRMVRSLGEVKFMGFFLKPKLSWEVEYVVDGATLYVRRGAVGHLPLAGPWRRRLAARVQAAARGHDKWQVWTQHIQKLESTPGSLTVTVAYP